MNPSDALAILEQAANMVQCDVTARRKLFEAVDVLRIAINRPSPPPADPTPTNP